MDNSTGADTLLKKNPRLIYASLVSAKHQQNQVMIFSFKGCQITSLNGPVEGEYKYRLLLLI